MSRNTFVDTVFFTWQGSRTRTIDREWEVLLRRNRVGGEIKGLNSRSGETGALTALIKGEIIFNRSSSRKVTFLPMKTALPCETALA